MNLVSTRDFHRTHYRGKNYAELDLLVNNRTDESKDEDSHLGQEVP